MQEQDQSSKIKALIDASTKVLILQPDNPDGDSLGSALALEQILMLQGKETELVCGIKMPGYLSYFPGWDRVSQELPPHYDLVILVDTSSLALIDNSIKSLRAGALSQRPLIVIDHHATPASIDFASASLIEASASATAEVIYNLCKQLGYELNDAARNALVAAILSDTLGLTTDNVSARTLYSIAEMVEQGVSLANLEAARRANMRKSADLVHYKGELLKRIQYFDNDRIALVVIPWSEIERYSPLYNPSVLALEDMRLTEGTAIAIALKIYRDGKITAKIRSNQGHPIAGALAENFGGGGHDYASGFKLYGSQDSDSLIKSLIAKASELLNAGDN